MSAAVLRLFDQAAADARGCDTACRQLENALEGLGAENARLLAGIAAKDDALLAPAERCGRQSELLSRAAERGPTTDGG